MCIDCKRCLKIVAWNDRYEMQLKKGNYSIFVDGKVWYSIYWIHWNYEIKLCCDGATLFEMICGIYIIKFETWMKIE